MKSTIRAAVLGLGRMGRRHLQVVRDLGLRLVGACDARAESLEAAAKECGLDRELLFADAAALLDRQKPECVVVATTAPAHAPLTCLAAERGAKFVLCEKPMATSLAECDRMIDTCRRTGTRLAVNHQMRFMEQYLEVHRILDSDAFGGWTALTVVAGNFGLAMNGTHYFELFRWLAGQPLAEVAAWFSAERVPNPRGPEFEDWAGSVRGSSAGGRRFSLEAGADQGHGLRAVYSGRNGMVVTDELAGRIEVSVRKAEHRSQPTTRYGLPWEDKVLAVAPADTVAPTRAVLNALLEGADVPTGEDGRDAVRALVAAIVSNESGHVPVAVRADRLPVDRRFPYA